MFFPETRVRVYLYGRPVDMRRSYDGLYVLALAAFGGDPTAGDLYAFVNRRGTQIKVLYFDRSGWCVWAKRLEAGVFVSDWAGVASGQIDCTQLKLLLEGIEPRRWRKRYRRADGADSADSADSADGADSADSAQSNAAPCRSIGGSADGSARTGPIA